uniref:hypothetical protein n=1 Tax=Emticicia sp. TaxID=1930953 RepID=UPI003750B37C
KDTSAVETAILFELESSRDTLGFCEMYKRTDIQIVLPLANGSLIWVGRQDSAAQLIDYTDSQGVEKSSNQLQIKTNQFSFTYLNLFYIN